MAGARDFSLHKNIRTVYRTQPASCPVGIMDPFSGGKAIGTRKLPLASIQYRD
jgi:hypothetical protein